MSNRLMIFKQNVSSAESYFSILVRTAIVYFFICQKSPHAIRVNFYNSFLVLKILRASFHIFYTIN